MRSRRAGNRAHLDDAVLLRVRVERVLNVALSDDAEMTDNVDGGRAEHVVVGIRERLGGGDDDRVSRVDSERVEVLRSKVISKQSERRGSITLTSMLQTVMQLSLQSRTTSYSISFQPFMLFSTRTCELVANAFVQSSTSSGSL